MTDPDELAERAAEILTRLPRPRDAIACLIFKWDRTHTSPRDRAACLTIADQIATTMAVYQAVDLDEAA